MLFDLLAGLKSPLPKKYCWKVHNCGICASQRGWDFSPAKTMEAGLQSCLTGLKSLLLRYADAFVGLKSKPLIIL